MALYRVPTVMENPGKSWKKVVMESYGKVIENSKNSEFHGNLFARKKSHGKVMEISYSCLDIKKSCARLGKKSSYALLWDGRFDPWS